MGITHSMVLPVGHATGGAAGPAPIYRERVHFCQHCGKPCQTTDFKIVNNNNQPSN